MSFCVTFTEDYKITKYLEIGPDVSWMTDIHVYTYKYFAVGAWDGQGGVETLIWVFNE